MCDFKILEQLISFQDCVDEYLSKQNLNLIIFEFEFEFDGKQFIRRQYLEVWYSWKTHFKEMSAFRQLWVGSNQKI